MIMRSMVAGALLLFSSTVLADETSDDFVPKDIAHAVAIACMVSGDKGPPPYAEAQVAVKYDLASPKRWDYTPIIARYQRDQGGVMHAIDDCTDWLKLVRKRIEEASHAPAAAPQAEVPHPEGGVQKP